MAVITIGITYWKASPSLSITTLNKFDINLNKRVSIATSDYLGEANWSRATLFTANLAIYRDSRTFEIQTIPPTARTPTFASGFSEFLNKIWTDTQSI